MVNYLEIISNMMQQPHYLLLVLIAIYTVAGTIDFLIGTITVNKDQYSSRISQLGILRKIVTLAIMFMVIPLALMLPMEVGVYSLTILYIGIVGSEIYSIMGHIGLVKDGDKDKHKDLTGNLLVQFINKLFATNKIK